MSGGGTKAGGSPDYLLNFLYPRALTEYVIRCGFAPNIETQPLLLCKLSTMTTRQKPEASYRRSKQEHRPSTVRNGVGGSLIRERPRWSLLKMTKGPAYHRSQ